MHFSTFAKHNDNIMPKLVSYEKVSVMCLSAIQLLTIMKLPFLSITIKIPQNVSL